MQVANDRFTIHDDVVDKIKSLGLNVKRIDGGLLVTKKILPQPYNPVVVTRISNPESRIGIVGAVSSSNTHAALMLAALAQHTDNGTPIKSKIMKDPLLWHEGRHCSGSKLSKDINRRKKKKQRMALLPPLNC